MNSKLIFAKCGPFVDAEHKKISSNEIEGTFEDEFLGIVDLISQRISSLSIQVFLVPSTRDVHHDALFPQPSFSLPSELKSIRCVENPSLLSLEPFGVTIGISSVDSLMDLSRISLEMIKAEGASPRDRLQDLSALMVKQKSFYPILPPPVRSELNLSMEMLQKLEFEPVPDILICPSLLAQFVKNVECLDSGKTVLCVNPGHLTKGDSAGAYAEITIHPLENKPVCEKTRIDLYKI